MPNYGAYLEDYHEIKVIIPNNFRYQDLFIESSSGVTELKVFKKEEYGSESHLYCYYPGYINLRMDFYVRVIGDKDTLKYYLKLGKITRSPRFDIDFEVKEPLGVRYSPNGKKTIFTIWGPCCKEVILCLEGKEYPLSYTERGVWKLVINDHIKNMKYHYKFRVNLEYQISFDPNALSYTPNFGDCLVVDLADSYQMEEEYLEYNPDPIIYEISIKDLTPGGTFKDATESFNTDYGFGYIKDLGISHVEILPVYGFGGVDEVKKDNYNWGYNPVCYKAISNYLTKDYNNPVGAISEYKELVDNCHKHNIGVIMDVVYNHVFDVNTFPFGLMTPGYGYHTDKKDFLTNVSGCGNDVNTKRRMVRHFFVELSKYLVKEFKIDGLRFDLMCLLDVKTMNIIKEEVKKINPNIILLGEGWNMESYLPSYERANMNNFYFLSGFSFFNDSFRNIMKCGFDLKDKGFCLGGKKNNLDLFSAFTGYTLKEELWNDINFSVNYVECHDNYTFKDALMLTNPKLKDNEIIDYIILSLGCVVLSLGHPFLHLGEEFGRSKKLHDNSYNLGIDINGIKWEEAIKYQEGILALKEFIKLRKKYAFFRIKDLNKALKNINLDRDNKLLKIRYYDEESNADYVLIVKNNYDLDEIYFAPGNKMVFDGRKETDIVVESAILSKPGLYLYKK